MIDCAKWSIFIHTNSKFTLPYFSDTQAKTYLHLKSRLKLLYFLVIVSSIGVMLLRFSYYRIILKIVSVIFCVFVWHTYWKLKELVKDVLVNN